MTETVQGDPTAIPIQFDPREQRMRGRAVHGGTYFDVPFISEIAPGLWLGGCENGLVLPSHIDRVLSLYPWERYELGLLQKRIEVKLYDAGLPAEETIFDCASLVANWRRRGLSVLVHCQAGLNRSSLIMGTYLVKHCRLSGQHAIDVLRAKRSPAVLCNLEFESWLRDLRP